MLEVGWSELLVIAVVMIIVVGPKDLPKMLRNFALFAKKARGMANDFQSQFTEAMRDAELDDVRKTIADVRSLNPKNAIRDAFDPIRKAGEDVKREMQGLKDTTQNSISGTPPSASPSTPVAEPVVMPQPSIALPEAAPTELKPVEILKPKIIAETAAGAKPASVKKPRAKKTDAKA